MNQKRNMRFAAFAGAIGTVGILTLSVVQTAHADNGTDTSALRDAVSADAIIDRLHGPVELTAATFDKHGEVTVVARVAASCRP